MFLLNTVKPNSYGVTRGRCGIAATTLPSPHFFIETHVKPLVWGGGESFFLSLNSTFDEGPQYLAATSTRAVDLSG